MNAHEVKGWFSVRSAADYSDFSVSAIESAIRLGHIKHKRVKIKGTARCVRIKREWLDAWIESQPED